MIKSRVGVTLGVACALVAIGGALYAQDARSSATSTQDALLAEVRALRAEIGQVAGISIRTQLLVARLQLQEQRILTAGRQLAEVQQSLDAVRREMASQADAATRLEEAARESTDPAEQRGLRQEASHLRTAADQKRKRELELQGKSAETLNVLNSEQARWTDFNNRLDALEQSLATPPSR